MTIPTKLVEQAFAVIRQLPPETQDDIARMVLALVDGEPALTMDDAAPWPKRKLKSDAASECRMK
jgi:hypothetical protein